MDSAEPVDVGRFLEGINLSRYFIKLLECGFASFKALEAAQGKDLRQKAGVLPGHFRLLKTALTNRRTGLGLDEPGWGDPIQRLEKILGTATLASKSEVVAEAEIDGQLADEHGARKDGFRPFGRPVSVAPLKFKDEEEAAANGLVAEVDNLLQAIEEKGPVQPMRNKSAPQKMDLVEVNSMPSSIGAHLERRRIANRERDREKDKHGYMDADKDIGIHRELHRDPDDELKKLPDSSLSAVRSLTQNWKSKTGQDGKEPKEGPRRLEDVFERPEPGRGKDADKDQQRRGLSRSRSISAAKSESDNERRKASPGRRRPASRSRGRESRSCTRSRSRKRSRSPPRREEARREEARREEARREEARREEARRRSPRERRRRGWSRSRSHDRGRPTNFARGVADTRVGAFCAPPSMIERGNMLSTAPQHLVPTPCQPFVMFGQETLRLTQVQIRCLLGKHGATVQSIMRQTGSQIVVTSPPTWAEGVVRVSGNYKPALAMIQQVLAEKGCPMPMDANQAFDANGPGIVEVPPNWVGRLVGRTAFFVEVQKKLGEDTVIQKLSKYAPNGNQYVQIAGTRWKEAKQMVLEWVDRVTGKTLARAQAQGLC